MIVFFMVWVFSYGCDRGISLLCCNGIYEAVQRLNWFFLMLGLYLDLFVFACGAVFYFC